jgi:hypothetical protein
MRNKLIISQEVSGPWPIALSVSLHPDKPKTFGMAHRTSYTDGSHAVDIRLGVKSGLCMPALAHEALHGAEFVLRLAPKWREYMPAWACASPLEESKAWVCECITWTAIHLAQQHNIELINIHRKIAGQPDYGL